MNKKAFTLLEVIIVVAIMAILFAGSIPLFSRFMQGSKLDTAARSVVSVLRTARSLAITHNSDYYAFFDDSKTPNEYFISSQENGLLKEEKIYKLPSGIWFYKIVGGAAIEFTKGTHATALAACFKSTGELDESGADTFIYIADGNDVSAQNQKTITVERTTGRARIE